MFITVSFHVLRVEIYLFVTLSIFTDWRDCVNEWKVGWSGGRSSF